MGSFTKKSILSSLVITLLATVSGCSNGGSSDGGATSDNGVGTTTGGTTVSVIPTGFASVGGSIATASSGISASSAFKASALTSTDVTATAELIVDINDNGIFGDTEDKFLTSTVGSNGSFDFSGVSVRLVGDTKAQLNVAKQGFAPVTKIVTLRDGNSISVEADAASTPLLTEVVDISAIRAQGSMASSFLRLGTKRTNDGLSSYSSIVSLSDMKALADIPIDGDVETETIIPLGSLPDSVTSITAQTQSFDPTDEDDAAKFPGEYVGTGEPGKGEQRLVSVGFDYMALTDQNGDPIELDSQKLSTSSKLLPQAVDYSSCLRTSTRHLNASQIELFKKYGDDDNTTDEFEIPLWYYNASAGNWAYLGQAEVYEADGSTNFSVDSTATYAYAKMCITENWGTSVNLDYSIAPQEPLNICVIAKDQDGGAVTDLYVAAQKDTTRDGHYLSKDGKTKIALLVGNEVSDYTFSYRGSVTGWNTTTVQDAEIQSGGEDGCDNTINIEVVNPYSATLKVTVKELDGSLAVNKYVYVYNSTWGEDYYSKSAYTDENGIATFNVKPNTNYGVYYNTAVADVNINGSVLAPEAADNGRVATVTVQDEEKAPDVNVYMYNRSISDTAESINFYVSATDNNGDKISLTSLTLNGTSLVEGTDYTITSKRSYNSSEYLNAKLNLSSATLSAITPQSLSAGSYSLGATYSDGKVNGTNSQRFTVNENRAPVVSAVYLRSTNGTYTYINGTIKSGTYDIYAYTYDPDGDTLSKTYTLNGVSIVGTNLDLEDGKYTLIVTAEDASLSTSKTFVFYVGNHAPEITSFGATSYSVDLASQNTEIRLYAYATDRDRDTLSVQTTDGTVTLSPSYAGSNYFRSSYITIDANKTFSIYANDNDKNSTVKSLSITTYVANQAPVFDKELRSQQVAIGATVEFACLATDREDDIVSYDWYIDKIKQTAVGTTFSTVFNTSAVVTCVATDADILEPKSISSSATVTVIDTNAVGELIVNTIPGAVVATHDTTSLVPLITKVADSSGKSTFTISGTNRVTFSVSISPNLEVNEEVIFQDTLTFLSEDLDDICDEVENTTVPDACSAYSHDAFIQGSSIPNALGALILEGSSNTVESLDTNNDGSIDSAENYRFALLSMDYNEDGKITWSEFIGKDGDGEITTEFFVNVPVREYNINLDFDRYEREGPQEEDWIESPININFTSFIASTQISLFGWKGVTVDKDGNATLNTWLEANNGSYSFLAHYVDEENNVTKYLLEVDKTVDEIVTLSYTPSDFTLSAKAVSFVSNKDSYMSILAQYKNQDLQYIYSNEKDSVEMVNSNVLSYIITGEAEGFDEANNAGFWKEHYNFYGNGTLASRYNVADYPQLNISVSTDDVDTVSFAGSDLSRLTYTRIEYRISGYTVTEGDNNSDGSEEFTTANVSFNYTLVPSSVKIVDLKDLTTILPSVIANDLPDSEDNGCYEGDGYIDIELTEFKGVSETAFLDDVNSDSLYFNGYRSIYTSVSSYLYGPTATLRKAVNVKHTKPFSIGYESKSPFAQ